MLFVVWVCLIVYVCNNWINYILLISLLIFMKEVFKFNIKNVSVLRKIGIWLIYRYVGFILLEIIYL